MGNRQSALEDLGINVKNIDVKVNNYLFTKTEKLITNRILRTRSIWHFCTPKSATTYLDRILRELLKNEITVSKAVPVYGQRGQEPCIWSVGKHLRFFPYIFNKKQSEVDEGRLFFGHLHTKKPLFK